MNKKIIIPVIFSALILTSLSFGKSESAYSSSGLINFDVDAIQALSHDNGVEVRFVNSDISRYWNNESTDTDYLKELYEYNSDITSFSSLLYDHQACRDLYDKWDEFKPINNTLTWKSSIKATSYDVVVALDPELTQALYEEKGLTSCEYTMDNPYSNTHYFWQVTAHTGTESVKSSIFDFYSADIKRTLDIHGVSNTRDVGGFSGEFGTIKQGLIYRSARIDDIDEEGKEDLQKLNIQTDLDIRSKGEGLKNPGQLPNYYLKTLLGYAADFKEENRPKTVETLRVFANPNNYPIMFHCAVGRDRTGTLGIILQALAGASKEYIIHDYYTSMWSVTGAYSKGLDDLNLNGVELALSSLLSFGGNLSDAAEKFLLEREDTITGEKVGLTAAEIQSIRDIWSGKVEAPHAVKSFKAEENYEGKAFVKIKTIGHKDVAMMVEKGSTITKPYDLGESYAYYSNGTLFDFSKPITDTTYIYADYVLQYTITIHFVGLAKEDEILKLNYGEIVKFDKYETDGYTMLVVSDNGEEISKLNVRRDAIVNIIYFAK